MYGVVLKKMHYFVQKQRDWMEQTGHGILIGDLVVNNLQTRIMLAVLCQLAQFSL